MKYFLGIDLGTTGTKSMLFNENGDVLGRGYKSYELISTQATYYEQNPEDWYLAVCQSVKEALDSGKKLAKEQGTALICLGSLYMYKEVAENI